MKNWQTSRRKIPLDRPLVMGILNTTPDSFSDGGQFNSVDAALQRAEQMIAEGADIIDVGGESSRPGSTLVQASEEIERVLPVIEAITARFDIAISVDTTKVEVAGPSVDAGAEIVNDISGFRFDPSIAALCARTKAGLILMHSRGDFETMHRQDPVNDIIDEVKAGLAGSLAHAVGAGVEAGQIALDPGIGFSKTAEQNLELIAKLGRLIESFPAYPIIVGASRKSFIGQLTGEKPAGKRLAGSLAAAVIAVANGANIVRVHDVGATVEAIRFADALLKSGLRQGKVKAK
jgi:dihydropteroate synthase